MIQVTLETKYGKQDCLPAAVNCLLYGFSNSALYTHTHTPCVLPYECTAELGGYFLSTNGEKLATSFVLPSALDRGVNSLGFRLEWGHLLSPLWCTAVQSNVIKGKQCVVLVSWSVIICDDDAQVNVLPAQRRSSILCIIVYVRSVLASLPSHCFDKVKYPVFCRFNECLLHAIWSA